MRTISSEIKIINEGTIRFPILPNGPGWKTTEKENLSVIESGPGKIMISRILKSIVNAKRTICLQSFLFQETEVIDALVKAHEEKGVKIFILSSVDARLSERIEEEEDFIRIKYIQLIDNKFKNRFVHRSAKWFHAKYIIIDPKTNPKGFLCTNNFTDNGFTRNPELAVELTKEQCEELYKIFVYHFWEQSTDEQTVTNEFSKVKPINRFTLPTLETILLTSPNKKCNSLNETLISNVNKAKRTISFSTFLIDKNTELVKAILAKAKQKIAVTLFCRPIEKQFKDQLTDIINAGVQIYFHPLMHAKSLLIDNNHGFIFTSNLEENGLENGFEIGLTLTTEQTKDLVHIHKNWQTTFSAKVNGEEVHLKDLNEIFEFDDGKLIKKSLIEASNELKQKIFRVADLFILFNQKNSIPNKLTKSLKIKLTGEIENLPERIKIDGIDKFKVVEAEIEKGTKSKILVISDQFSFNDLKTIQNYKELRIYSYVGKK